MRILHVEDDRATARRYANALTALGHTVVTAATFAEGVAALEENHAAGVVFDAVLLDRNLDRTVETEVKGRRHISYQCDQGEDLTPLIRRLHPNAAIAVLSHFIDGPVSLRLAELGLLVVLKELDDENIADLARLLEHQRRSGSQLLRALITAFEVKPRHVEVFMAAVDGLDDKNTALQLGIAKRTVEEHWKQIRKAMGVRSRAQALAMIIRELRRRLDALSAAPRSAEVPAAQTAETVALWS